jgi:glycine/D-amino acid oxidase-like deaminating enzyme
MTSRQPTLIVLGAGVAGLSLALYLQRSGQQVMVIDPLPPAGGTSYGNAGLISSDTAVPIALPGMLGKVPRWLADREGPLIVRPSYLPTALPWLMRWIAASRMERVLRISDAMRALHKDSLVCWRELLGAEHYADLIRPVGQVRIWEGEGAESRIEMMVAERHGIKVERLDANALRQIYPDISPNVAHGLLVPGNAYTVNPQRLVRTLGTLLVDAGGEIIAERAMKIIPHGSAAGYRVITNISNRSAPKIVVATGAWTRELLDPLGIRVPLETERGYHATMPAPNLTLPIPISVKNRGFGLTSMEGGLRAAGTVEIGGLRAPLDERRAMVLVSHAKRIFPKLETGEPSYWMGHRPSTPDSLPVLGEAPGRTGLFFSFGHGHFGMTGSPPSARLVSQLVNGGPVSIDPAPYACNRF